jgi:hypothetical protein
MNWARFFLGTPVRFIMTLVVVAALAAVSKIWPGMIQSALSQLAQELSPLLQVALTIIIIGFGIRIIFNGLSGSCRRRNR